MKLLQNQETRYKVTSDRLPAVELYAASQIRLNGSSLDESTGELRDYGVFKERGASVSESEITELKGLIESGDVIDPDSVVLSTLQREGFDSSLTTLYSCKVSSAQEKVNLFTFADNIREALDKFDNFCSLYFRGPYIPMSVKAVKSKYIYDDETGASVAKSQNFTDVAPDRELRMVSVKLEVVVEGQDGKAYKSLHDYLVETDTAEKAVDIAKKCAEELDITEITVKSTKVDEGIFVQ